MKRTAVLLSAAVVALSGCSSGAEPRVEPVAHVQPFAPTGPARDQCGAGDLAYLVGRPKGEIPVPVDPTHRRVACTTCPVTMDYSPRRLNIYFDAESGVIREVKCG